MATTNIELDIENITGVSDANAQFLNVVYFHTKQKWDLHFALRPIKHSVAVTGV